MNSDDLARHRRMMQSPSLWPLFPCLPLVRPRGDGALDLGVLVDHPSLRSRGETRVVCANVLFLPNDPAQLLALPAEVFDSLDAILKAGWRVD